MILSNLRVFNIFNGSRFFPAPPCRSHFGLCWVLPLLAQICKFMGKHALLNKEHPNCYVPFDDEELVPTCLPAENPSDTVTLNGIADLPQAPGSLAATSN